MNLTPHLSTLSMALIAISGSHLAHAEDFNQVVFFGDSLSDSGYFTNFNPALGKFTTNPDKVWTEILAESYGLTSTANSNGVDGNNYAAGGAMSSTDLDKHPRIGLPVPSAKTQVNTYLANHTVDPNTLYSVWIGANDFLAATATPNTVVTTLTNTANDTATTVQTLANAGAKYIIVPNLPDVGKSPAGIASGQPDNLTQLANYHNRALYTAIDAGTANVIPIDTFSMIQEVVADPARYGISNVNGVACGIDPSTKQPNSSVTCNKSNLTNNNGKNGADANAYLFADGVHPTGTVHNILAQYTRSVLDSPSKFAQISKSATQAGWMNDRQLQRRLDTLQTGHHGVWVEGETATRQGGDANQTGNSYDSNTGSAGIIGAGLALGDHSQTGIYLKRQNNDYDVDSQVTYQMDETGFGFYHRHQLGNHQLNFHAGIDSLDIDWQRELALNTANRTHTAESGGRRKHLSLQVGRQFGFGGVDKIDKGSATYSPYLGALMQQLRINTLSENGDNATAMTFDKLDQDSLLGTIGVKVDYPMNDKYSLMGDVHYSHDFKHDDNQTVTAHLTSIPSYSRGFVLPVSSTDENNFGVSLGLNATLKQNMSVQVGATAQGSDSDNYQTGAYLGFNAQF